MTPTERGSSQGVGNLKKLWIAVGAVLMLTAAPPAARAQIGLIIDAGKIGDDVFTLVAAAHVFDATTDTVLGSVSFDTGIDGIIENNADCSMTSDGLTAYVMTSRLTTFPSTELQVLDLSDPTDPKTTSRIEIPLFAADTAISPDGQYLLVCDRGIMPSPLTVVTIPGGVVSTFDLGATACTAVDICTDTDTSVLVNDFAAGTVRRLTLDSDGVLTDTDESLAMGGAFTAGPINIDCSPSGTTGVAAVGTSGEVRSFTVPGLVPGQTQAVAGVTLAALISPDESRVFTRSIDSLITPPTAGTVDFFLYNSAGTIDALIPPIGFGVRRDLVIVGIESMAVHPNGSKLYVSEPFLDTLATPGEVNIYNTAGGGLIGPLRDEGDPPGVPSSVILTPTGICFPTPLVDGPTTFELTVSPDSKVAIDLIVGDDNDIVKINGVFELAGGSDGIDVLGEAVTLTFDGFGVIIPGGSFVEKTVRKKGTFFTFNDIVPGIVPGTMVAVDLKIGDLGNSVFEIKGSLSMLTLDKVDNPVLVALTIGNDLGSIEVTASFD